MASKGVRSSQAISITRSISINNLEIDGGDTFSDYIGFYPDDFLYQKHIFSLNYRTIDDPITEKVTESDTLDIIVEPNIIVESWFFPINATTHDVYSLDLFCFSLTVTHTLTQTSFY